MAKKYTVNITRTRDEIIELVQNGTIKTCDQIKAEGSETWNNVSTVDGLNAMCKDKNPSEKFRHTEKPKSKRQLLVKTTASFLILSLVICAGCWGVWSAMSGTQKEWAITKYTEVIHPSALKQTEITETLVYGQDGQALIAVETEDLQSESMSRNDLLEYLNLFCKSVSAMKDSVETSNSEGLLIALEGLQNTYQARLEHNWKPIVSQYLYAFSGEGMRALSKKDPELAGAFTSTMHLKNKLSRYLGQNRIDEDVRFRKKRDLLIDKILSNPSLAVRFTNIDLKQIQLLPLDLF